MDLRNFGDVFRKHYEKIILTLVLVGLALAVVFVFRANQRAQAAIDLSIDEARSAEPRGVAPVDLTAVGALIRTYEAPAALSFSRPHNLLNPVTWKRRHTGHLLKIENIDPIGWEQMKITRLISLTSRISLEKIPTPGLYVIDYQNEAAESPSQRKKYAPYLKLNETNKTVPRHIVLREIRGPLEKPEELIIEFIDTGERISINSEKPFERIEAYEADLHHELANQTFPRLRVGFPFQFLNDQYYIVAIAPNEVVASARANDKKYTVTQFATGSNTTNRISEGRSPASAP